MEAEGATRGASDGEICDFPTEPVRTSIIDQSTTYLHHRDLRVLMGTLVTVLSIPDLTFE